MTAGEARDAQEAQGARETPEAQKALEALVSVRDLRVTYGAGETAFNALDGITLDIYPGELTFIFGASGCGKTTLLNVMGGMATPTSGSIVFNGRDISRMSKRQKVAYRRDSIGFIFQHYNLIAGLTARENVAVSASLTPGSMDPLESLSLVGLAQKADSYPREMSGGQQQRVCIARAICKNAPLILADEPTGALDVENACSVMDILSDLVRNARCTVVMVTHNPDMAAMADRVVRLVDGKVAADERNAHPLSAAQCLMPRAGDPSAAGGPDPKGGPRREQR